VITESGTAAVGVSQSSVGALIALERANATSTQQKINSVIYPDANVNSDVVRLLAGRRSLDDQLHDESEQVPTSVDVSECTTQFVASVAFTCPIICGPIEYAFGAQINQYVNDKLQEQFCLQISRLAGENGSAALREFNSKFVAPLLRPPPLPSLSVLARDSVPLVGNAGVDLVDYVSDVVVGADGALNVNRIADHFTNGSGVLFVNATTLGMLVGNGTPIALPQFNTTINGTGTIQLSIESLNVSGLNTWTQFDILRPNSSWTLISRTAVRLSFGRDSSCDALIVDT
jgi:hypothetical protein